jgi:hypothetical protein
LCDHNSIADKESDSSSSGEDGLFLEFDSDDSGMGSNTTKSSKPMITELKSSEFKQRMETKLENVKRRTDLL